ncbi:MAG: hypothetical protein WKG01_38205 [Kofleriaceae bacterium]
MKRDTAQTIFRTVVFAGAMLGTTACGKKPAPAQPTSSVPTASEPEPSDQTLVPGKPDGDPSAPGVDPCAGGERPRGTDPDGGGGTGRGFILS